MEHKRIYIVVKTYPAISNKYAELVCTAGVLEDGSWIRLYPIPFRKLDIEQKYKKYTWIELDAVRNTRDFRPETYRPYDLSTLRVEKRDRSRKTNWDIRKQIIFNNKPIYKDLSEVINLAKVYNQSLAIFKPTRILDFIWEETTREWDAKKLAHLKDESNQLSLFQTPEEIEEEFRIVPKVPYRFSYKFEDITGRQSTLMIEDWEIGMLYFNCLKSSSSEAIALQKVKEKYYDYFLKRDLYFIMGTTKEWHNVAPNPFIIIGVFYPPKLQTEQMRLF